MSRKKNIFFVINNKNEVIRNKISEAEKEMIDMKRNFRTIMANRRIILVDPGTTIMGFGLIKVVNKKMEFIQLNELLLSKYDNHYKIKLILNVPLS
jgi:hypothetical protein